jgi:hypothetical protein
VQTNTAPVKLKLSADWPLQELKLASNGKGAAMLRVAVVDATGVFVPDTAVRVSFKVVSGLAAVIGVGNGDPSSHESDKGLVRTTVNGLGRCIIQTSLATTAPSSSSSDDPNAEAHTITDAQQLKRALSWGGCTCEHSPAAPSSFSVLGKGDRVHGEHSPAATIPIPKCGGFC